MLSIIRVQLELLAIRLDFPPRKSAFPAHLVMSARLPDRLSHHGYVAPVSFVAQGKSIRSLLAKSAHREHFALPVHKRLCRVLLADLEMQALGGLLKTVRFVLEGSSVPITWHKLQVASAKRDTFARWVPPCPTQLQKLLGICVQLVMHVQQVQQCPSLATMGTLHQKLEPRFVPSARFESNATLQQLQIAHLGMRVLPAPGFSRHLALLVPSMPLAVWARWMSASSVPLVSSALSLDSQALLDHVKAASYAFQV